MMGTNFLVRRLPLQRLRHPSHGIVPAIPRPDLCFQDRLASARRLQPQRFDVGIHHDGHQVMEFNARFPTQRRAAFCSVGNQSVDFQGTKVAFGNLYVLLPFEPRVRVCSEPMAALRREFVLRSGGTEDQIAARSRSGTRFCVLRATVVQEGE